MRTLFALLIALCLPFTATEARLLDGAGRMLDADMGAAELSPAIPYNDSYKLVVGLDSWFTVRNDRLSIGTWNDHVGHFLDDEEKRAILDEMGGVMGAHQRMILRPLALIVPFKDKRQSMFGMSLELVSQAHLQMDTELFELAFFGNDPNREIVIDHADLDAELTAQVRLTFSRVYGMPASWPAWIAGRPVRFGIGLQLERLGLRSSTESFDNSIQPVVGEFEAWFRHTQKTADTGFGKSFDLGAQTELELLDRPLLVDVALRGLLHSRDWRHVEEELRVFEVPETGIDTDFDEEIFSDAIMDTTITTDLGASKVRLSPGWTLGLRWEQTKTIHHAFLIEELPETSIDVTQRRASWYTRWNPKNSILYLGAELSGGMGRGPGIGGELQLKGRFFEFGIGLKGYAGIGNSSRGITTGIMARFRL